jgi:hypothetical protein
MKRLSTGLAALILLAGTALSQTSVETLQGTGAVLRALDILTGKVVDIELKSGTTATYERLKITLKECRYPIDNRSADAFAYLTIVDVRQTEPRFQGWMVASSPGLSALDHPRYDVWVLRCSTSDG